MTKRIRKLLKCEITDAVRLFKANGKEFNYADEATLLYIYNSGEIWGLFGGASLCACACVCSVRLDVPICRAAAKTLLLDKQCILIPPVCGTEKEQLYKFLNTQYDAPLCLLLPIKCEKHELCAVFSAGFTLFAMRPMHELRPTYMFKKAHAVLENSSLQVPYGRTLPLSRLLENGYIALAFDEENFILCK